MRSAAPRYTDRSVPVLRFIHLHRGDQSFINSQRITYRAKAELDHDSARWEGVRLALSLGRVGVRCLQLALDLLDRKSKSRIIGDPPRDQIIGMNHRRMVAAK